MPKIARAKLQAIEKALRGVYPRKPSSEYYDYCKASGLTQPTVKTLLGRLGIPLPTSKGQGEVGEAPDAQPGESTTQGDVQGPPTAPEGPADTLDHTSDPQGDPATPKAQERGPRPTDYGNTDPAGIGLMPQARETPKAQEPTPATATAPAPPPEIPKVQAPASVTLKAHVQPNAAPMIQKAMQQTADVERRTVSLEQQVHAIIDQMRLKEQKGPTQKAREPDEETEKGDLEARAEKAATGTIASAYAGDVGVKARKTFDWDIAAGQFIREKWESTGYRAEFATPAVMAEEVFAFYADHRTSVQEFAEENERLKLRVEALERVAAPGYRAQLRTKALTEICIATKIAGGSFAAHEMAVVIQGLNEVLNGHQ